MILLSRFKVSGHSMEPTFSSGTTLLVSSIPYILREPKIGDIAVFSVTGKIFVKRIKKKEGQRYFLAGDNTNDSFDSQRFGWVRRENILGKVAWVLS